MGELRFYYGVDSYRVDHAAEVALGTLVVRIPSLQVRTIDCAAGQEQISLGEIKAALRAQDLFSTAQCIVLKDFFASFDAEDQRGLLDFLQSEGTAHDLFFVEHSQPRKNAKLFTYLEKNAQESRSISMLAGQELERWIEGVCDERGVKISRDASRLLALAFGDSAHATRLIAHECDKLCAFSFMRSQRVQERSGASNPSASISDMGHASISAQDVTLLVTMRVSGDIFAAIEALTSGRGHMSMRLFKKQIAAGESPHQVFAMYVYQVRNLLRIRSMYDMQSTRGSVDSQAIARELKIHPFVAQKGLAVARKIPIQALKRTFGELLQIDRDVKTGRREIESALEIFIAQYSER